MHQVIFTDKKVARNPSISRINQLCEDTPQGANPNPVQSGNQRAKCRHSREVASRHTATPTAATQIAPSPIPSVPKIAFTWPSYKAPISQLPRFRLTPARARFSAIWLVSRQTSRSNQDMLAGHPGTPGFVVLVGKNRRTPVSFEDKYSRKNACQFRPSKASPVIFCVHNHLFPNCLPHIL